MEGPDQRAADEHELSEHASAQPGPAPTADWQVFERNRRNVQRQREQLLELATTVAATQERLAATFGALAERAVREGRTDDARRLASEAHAALRGAEHERQEVERWRQPTAGERRADAAREQQDEGGSEGAGSPPRPAG
jgi:hypothetical protein